MIGYIYLSTCLVTNKVYVGMTRQQYKLRWRDHIKDSFDENSTSYNFYFHKAIRKHGKESFKWEIIETVEKDTLKELIATLKKLEIKYIKKYNSYKEGYNSTLGGDYSGVQCKEVNVYDDNGNLLNSFETVAEASEYYKISKGTIWSQCGGFSLYTMHENKRIAFRWKLNGFTELDKEELSKIHYNASICMYDLEGNLVQTFSDISNAAETLNLKRERITTNCRKCSSFVLVNDSRYIFRYFDEKPTEEDLNKIKNIKSDPKSKVRAIDMVTGEIIGEFSSQSEGARKLNTNSGRISQVCNGQRKSAGKYNEHPIKWIKI